MFKAMETLSIGIVGFGTFGHFFVERYHRKRHQMVFFLCNNYIVVACKMGASLHKCIAY